MVGKLGCGGWFAVLAGLAVALFVGAVVASCSVNVMAEGPDAWGCTVVECKLRSGCWPREPDTGAYHWDAMVFGLEQGELGCAGSSKILTLRDWRGRKYSLQIMELTDRRTEAGDVLWYRTRDFRVTGTP